MKFIESSRLARISGFLETVDLTDCVVQGDLEVFSCKLIGLDKTLSQSLENELLDALNMNTPVEMAFSPLGPLTEAASRRTLVYLILTLNQIYPDYDFTTLRARHFSKEGYVGMVKHKVDTALAEVTVKWAEETGNAEGSFLEELWSAIDEVVSLVDCDVYSYNSDQDSDPFGERGSVWSFNYFFYNKRAKKIAYLSCRSKSKAVLDGLDEEADGTMDDDFDDFAAGDIEMDF